MLHIGQRDRSWRKQPSLCKVALSMGTRLYSKCGIVSLGNMSAVINCKTNCEDGIDHCNEVEF